MVSVCVCRSSMCQGSVDSWVTEEEKNKTKQAALDVATFAQKAFITKSPSDWKCMILCELKWK